MATAPALKGKVGSVAVSERKRERDSVQDSEAHGYADAQFLAAFHLQVPDYGPW